MLCASVWSEKSHSLPCLFVQVFLWAPTMCGGWWDESLHLLCAVCIFVIAGMHPVIMGVMEMFIQSQWAVCFDSELGNPSPPNIATYLSISIAFLHFIGFWDRHRIIVSPSCFLLHILMLPNRHGNNICALWVRKPTHECVMWGVSVLDLVVFYERRSGSGSPISWSLLNTPATCTCV